jgi:hypothetical protein
MLGQVIRLSRCGKEAVEIFYPGSHLSRLKKAVKRVNFLTASLERPDHSAPSIPATYDSHPHDPLRRCRRVIDHSTSREIMILSIEPLFNILPRDSFNGTVAGYHNCLRHGEPTMRIFPSSLGGDFYFRCHQCGETLSTIEVLKTQQVGGQNSWKDVADVMHKYGIVADPIAPGKLASIEALARFRGMFDLGAQQYRYGVDNGTIKPRFGHWLGINHDQLFPLLDGLGLPRRLDRDSYLARVTVNPFGFPAAVHFYTAGTWIPVAHVMFSTDGIEFDMPRWGYFCDWTENLIICHDHDVACAVEREVIKWNSDERVAVATIAKLSAPLISYYPPFTNVWIVNRSGQGSDHGLAFCQDPSVQVRVLEVPVSNGDHSGFSSLTREQICDPGLPSCLDMVAERLARDSRPIPPVLSTALAKPWVTQRVAQEVIARVCQLRGIEVSSIAQSIEAASNPYGFQYKGAVYICRNDQIWKRAPRKSQFEPISNFTARIAYRDTRAGNNLLHIQLKVGTGIATLCITEAVLDNPHRLWGAIRVAAEKAGLERSTIFTPGDRKLLPEIIRRTRKPS